MKKRLILFALTAVMTILALGGCAKKPELKRYDTQFLRLFDTVTSITGYTEDEKTFQMYSEEFYQELETYHQLYDIYNNYPGINNIKTINDNAGVMPVKVDQKIIDLLEFAIQLSEQADGKMNVAMGSVLSIWHDYRMRGIEDPAAAALPDIVELENAAQYCDIRRVEIDKENSTVYLPDKHMSLDVGAIAKGYAAEQVCRKLEADGLTSALISVGGNVRAIGKKPDGSLWKVGIQNPDLTSAQSYLYTVEISDMALVSSGSYQRYYTVDGKTYHHIINPDTLMPWDEYVSVSILCKDSGMADGLSTSVFNMSIEDGKAFIESLPDTEAMWIYRDGTEVYSSGFEAYLLKE